MADFDPERMGAMIRALPYSEKHEWAEPTEEAIAAVIAEAMEGDPERYERAARLLQRRFLIRQLASR